MKVLALLVVFSGLSFSQGVVHPRQILRNGAALNECLKWNGTVWAPGACGGGGSVTNAAALTVDMPVFGDGGNAVKVGTKTGTGNEAVMSASPTISEPRLANAAEATCDSSIEGKMTVVTGGAGVASTVRVCLKDSSDIYAWRPIV